MNPGNKDIFSLQNQVATLLQVKSCHADASQIQRLTQALVQKEGEVKMLNTKISSLEKQKVVLFISLSLWRLVSVTSIVAP